MMPAMVDDEADLAPCYRHPDRLTGIACSNCGRPICTDCATQTPVGQRCPECTGRQRVLRPRAVAAGTPIVTYSLIAINVFVFVVLQNGLSGGSLGAAGGLQESFTARFLLYGPAIATNHEYYRLLTSAFLHGSLLHIGFNMYALWLFGPALEQRLGRLRYVLLYLVAGLWGSAGALLLTPHSPTLGASGAIFGVLGAIAVAQRLAGARGFGGVGMIVAINLVLSLRPGISIGGHIGGLIGGVLAAYLLEKSGVFRRSPGFVTIAGMAALAAIGIAAGIAFAGR
jgi:membrane associated rhomboid family serine protease